VKAIIAAMVALADPAGADGYTDGGRHARASNRSRAEVAAERDAKMPLRGRMGTGWDVANAALFLPRTRPISSPG
jgi:hypothetical protein